MIFFAFNVQIMEYVSEKADFDAEKMIMVMKSVQDVPWYKMANPVFAILGEMYQTPVDPDTFLKLEDLAKVYPAWAKHVCGILLKNTKSREVAYVLGSPSMQITHYYYKNADEKWVFHNASAKKDFLALSSKI